MASGYAKRAMATVKKLSKDNPGKTSFTATETGARKEALKRFAAGPARLKGLAKGSPGGTIRRPMGEPSSDEIENMISGRGRK